MNTELTLLNFDQATALEEKARRHLIPLNAILKTTLLVSLFFLSATQCLYAQPATPVGFVANTGSGPGEMFLAVGPNDVENMPPVVICYRLFFSPTASAPADPLTATEYIFGSTGGDGGGFNAFGFTMTGLTPGVDYTFWLYQYDHNTGMFSVPSVKTQISGDYGPPATPVGFVTNPTGTPGEMFLAVGPNQVGNPNGTGETICYRLFFSPTASAPADPLTATEYIFGSTGGDNGGFAAFGFTMTGLTPGVDYTFWLYQYNHTTMTFSLAPASSSETSLPVTWYAPLKAAVMDNNAVQVNWSVADQLNNDEFIIEHSSNGRNFSPIGNIRGGGTTDFIEAYSYIDRNPVLGHNYYRIRQVDFDGRFDFSNIATVWLGEVQTTTIYPNPASSMVTISLTKETKVVIKNFYGRAIKSLSLLEGENLVPLDDISNGIYMLEFENGYAEILLKI